MLRPRSSLCGGHLNVNASSSSQTGAKCHGFSSTRPPHAQPAPPATGHLPPSVDNWNVSCGRTALRLYLKPVHLLYRPSSTGLSCPSFYLFSSSRPALWSWENICAVHPICFVNNTIQVEPKCIAENMSRFPRAVSNRTGFVTKSFDSQKSCRCLYTRKYEI